jgi:hypothetical protein
MAGVGRLHQSTCRMRAVSSHAFSRPSPHSCRSVVCKYATVDALCPHSNPSERGTALLTDRWSPRMLIRRVWKARPARTSSPSATCANQLHAQRKLLAREAGRQRDRRMARHVEGVVDASVPAVAGLCAKLGQLREAGHGKRNDRCDSRSTPHQSVHASRNSARVAECAGSRSRSERARHRAVPPRRACIRYVELGRWPSAPPRPPRRSAPPIPRPLHRPEAS